MDTLKIFKELSGEIRNDVVLKWKADGKQVIGLTCSNIPEEIVHAAGFLPLRMRANPFEDTSNADVFLHRVNCSYVRSALELQFADETNLFDALITTNTCDHHLSLSDISHYKENAARFKLVRNHNDHYFQMYHTNSDGGRELFISEMKKLIAFLNDKFSISIEDSDLRDSIKVYNKTRTLMQDLNELRKKNPPLLTGSEYMKVVLTGMSIRKEEFNGYLEALIAELSRGESDAEKLPRIMLMGSGCDSPEFVNFIESKDFVIAADNMCFGSRHYHGTIDENSDDVLGAISDRYFNTISCSSVMDDFDRNYDMIMNVIDEMNIQGIIVARLKFCDHMSTFSKMLKDVMPKEKGIPVLDIEREYTSTGSGQISTRLQAFHEVLKG